MSLPHLNVSRRALLSLAAVPVAARVAGVSAQDATPIDGTPAAIPSPSPVLPATVTDIDGNSVEVTDVSRIVPLSGDVAEIVWTLGLAANVVGVDVSAVYPAGQWDALPKIGFERQLSAEGILALTPTVIVGKEQAGPAPVLEQLRGAGVPVVIIPEPQTIEAPVSKIRDVADALAAQGALASDITTDTAANTLYAIVNESVYLRLVDGCGWTPNEYHSWLARTLRKALLGQP